MRKLRDAGRRADPRIGLRRPVVKPDSAQFGVTRRHIGRIIRGATRAELGGAIGTL
jgi:hypothetical protein